MKTKPTNFEKLRRFFLNAFANAETSQTEIEDFLENYIDFIFELNHLNRGKYQINIAKVAINEQNSKREKKHKNEANKEKRILIKRKVLTKPSFKANCGNHYFVAVMLPDPNVETEYKILINKNLCHAKNDNEIVSLTELFNIFGHEVHHIIQYIKRPKEMDRYDYLQELHEAYLENADKIVSSPKEVKKLKRAINQHLTLLYSNCDAELAADKKGYDYLDILFNQIISTLPPIATVEDHMLYTFFKTLQETNEQIYSDRVFGSNLVHLKNQDSFNRLTNFPVEEDLIEIN